MRNSEYRSVAACSASLIFLFLIFEKEGVIFEKNHLNAHVDSRKGKLETSLRMRDLS